MTLKLHAPKRSFWFLLPSFLATLSYPCRPAAIPAITDTEWATVSEQSASSAYLLDLDLVIEAGAASHSCQHFRLAMK